MGLIWCQCTSPQAKKFCKAVEYTLFENKLTSGCHEWANDLHTKYIREMVVAQKINQLRNQVWTPELILGHSGWGEMPAIYADS